ncbi:MAG: sugar phosphate isomerase/epimerase family protein [Thermoleophilaceae bacterium]
MKLGVLTVVYADRPLEAVLDRVAELGLDAVELGTGNYPGDAHCPPRELLADPSRARALRDAVTARGLTISALSCHGNPLHPRQEIADAHQETWRATLQLAELLEIDVVNTFSGCPGDGPGARHPNWVICPWPPDFEELLAWQWNERVLPYWGAEAEQAARHGVRGIGLEMHPGFVVYNPETLLRLRREAGERIGANFDPSHLVWQGIDPIEAVRELGRAGAIFHAHAKDTYIDAANVRRNGVLDAKPYARVLDRAWTFRTVGYGHGESMWRDLVSALRTAGYDGVLSIEHEDILASRDEGLERAVALLRGVLLREPAGEMWWS